VCNPERFDDSELFIGKEAAVAYFKVIFRHLLPGSNGNYENRHSEVILQARL
jgi:hypothetical protein